MKTSQVLMVVAGVMVLEGLVAFAMWPSKGEAPKNEPRQERRARARDVQESADAKALRQRIRDLEQRLQEANLPVPEEKVAKQDDNAGDRNNRRDRNGPPSMQDMRERMERFAKENPEQFAQMTNRMAQGRQRQLERQQRRLDLLASVDTTKMTAEQKATHEKFQELIARQEELRDYMRPDANVTDEERQQAFEQMRDTERQMRDASRAERDTLLSQAAQNMGYSADEATEVVNQIKEIYQATEGDNGWGRGGPGGGPGGFGPGMGGNGGNRGGRRQ